MTAPDERLLDEEAWDGALCAYGVTMENDHPEGVAACDHFNALLRADRAARIEAQAKLEEEVERLRVALTELRRLYLADPDSFNRATELAALDAAAAALESPR